MASIILFDTNKLKLPFLNLFLWLSTNLLKKESTAIKIQILYFFEKKSYIRNKSIIFLQMLVIKFNLTLTTFIVWYFGAKKSKKSWPNELRKIIRPKWWKKECLTSKGFYSKLCLLSNFLPNSWIHLLVVVTRKWFLRPK